MTALRKVLVVDDDPVVGASFNRVLSGKGYIVVSAENGFDALAMLKAEKFDAVFTDLRMPGMDGVQVAEKVHAAQPWTPVVIVTGYGSPASEARARAAGVTEFLHKPLSPEMIEDSAAKAVLTVPAVTVVPTAATPTPVQPAEQAATGRRVTRTLKNMALFLVAPFIGLAYAVLLPFVGFGMLLWVATEGWRGGKAVKADATPARPELTLVPAPAAEVAAAPAEPVAARHGALAAAKFALRLVGAPFIGLAYAVLLPFVGLGMLLWVATEGWRGGKAVKADAAPAAPVAARHGALAAGKFALGLVSAPFIGLAYVIVLPFAGIAALTWFAGKAAFSRTE